MKQFSNKNLLLISADAALREAHAEILEKRGFRVLVAETGHKGLITLRDHLVDVIVLDYATPFARYDSSEKRSKTLEAITDANPLLPLILLCSSTEELSYATSLMADMILAEPVEPAILLESVETVLQETLRERARRKAGSISILR